MKCPICNTRVPAYSDRCPDCGFLLSTQSQQTAEPSSHPLPLYTYTPTAEAPRREHRFRPVFLIIAAALLLPIAVTLFGVGLAQFALQENTYSFIEDDVIASVPYGDYAWDPEAYADCFLVEDNELIFLSERWAGGPILEIPEYVDGEQVTSIAPGAFQDCTGLTTILLPDSVTVIGSNAFAGCRDLRGLFLPEGTEYIGDGAFQGCIHMEAIHIPSTVTYIGTGSFDDCASMLYLFYNGEFETWRALFNEYINPFTTAICLDGNYYHGVQD